MLYGFLVFVHIVVSLGLITTVLMQASKGGGLAGAFGGSGMAGSVFGGRGAAPFLVKVTTVFAIIFMITSLSLSYVRPGNQAESVFERSSGGATSTPSAPAVTDQMPLAPANTTQTQTAPGAAIPGTDMNTTGGDAGQQPNP